MGIALFVYQESFHTVSFLSIKYYLIAQNATGDKQPSPISVGSLQYVYVNAPKNQNGSIYVAFLLYLIFFMNANCLFIIQAYDGDFDFATKSNF